MISASDMYGYYVKNFIKKSNQEFEKWRNELHDMLNRKEKVVVWGAGSKGATFLNINLRQNNIRYIVDVNPRKHGMYLSGSGQKIVPPEFLKDYQPDTIIIMNPIYVEEIKQMIRPLNLSSEIRPV